MNANSLFTALNDHLGQRHLKHLVATARGRAFLLGFLASAEEADEQGVFDHLLARVDDPALQKMVRHHRDDEVRHAQLLRACVARQGVEPEPIPDSLHYVQRLDSMLGGIAAKFVSDHTSIMETYALLQLIEERGVRQFPFIAIVLRPVDPESADVLQGIIADEVRHVRVSRRISERYAPDSETLSSTLAEMRRVERLAFVDHSVAFARYVEEHLLTQMNGVERIFWRGLLRLSVVRRSSTQSSLAHLA